MKNTLGILAIFVLLVAGAMLFSGCGQKTDNTATTVQQTEQSALEEPKDEGSSVAKPWIQVVKEGVFLASTGTDKIALKTGDELNEGAIVETDETGLANISFPDGSVARLDAGTRITMVAGTYDTKNQTLIVKIKLTAGNIWSKIMKLATPESVWEVKTSNAVAAVRGTAFGMSHIKGKTRIIGSEHTIRVFLVDPKTGQLIESQSADLSEDKYLEITSDLIAKYLSGEKTLLSGITSISKDVLKENWIIQSLNADQRINARIKAMEDSGLTDIQALELYREEISQEYQTYLRTTQEDPVYEVVSSTGKTATGTGSVNLLDVSADSGVVTDSESNITIEPDTGSNDVTGAGR